MHNVGQVRSKTIRMRTGGRLVIPAVIREAAGIHDGEDVLVEVSPDGVIRLIPLSRAIQYAQDILAPFVSKDRSMADELIAERRAEAARE